MVYLHMVWVFTFDYYTLNTSEVLNTNEKANPYVYEYNTIQNRNYFYFNMTKKKNISASESSKGRYTG